MVTHCKHDTDIRQALSCQERSHFEVLVGDRERRLAVFNLEVVVIQSCLHNRLYHEMRECLTDVRRSHIDVRGELVMVFLLIHLVELVRAIAPGVFICLVLTVIDDLLVKVVKIFVTLCADVSRIEGLLIHRQPLDPLFCVNIINLGLFVN